MGCSEYGGYRKPSIDIICRLAHFLRMLEISEPVHGEDNYIGEMQAADFHYRYFIPHNKG